jgi:hypothetical protein
VLAFAVAFHGKMRQVVNSGLKIPDFLRAWKRGKRQDVAFPIQLRQRRDAVPPTVAGQGPKYINTRS